MPEPYEKLKAATRGQAVTQDSMLQLLATLQDEVPAEALSALKALTPAAYVGNAEQQAQALAAHLQQELQ